MGNCLAVEKNQTGMFYGNGSNIKKSAKETEIGKTDSNNLMAKAISHRKV